jgi:hypothetical protein
LEELTRDDVLRSISEPEYEEDNAKLKAQAEAKPGPLGPYKKKAV